MSRRIFGYAWWQWIPVLCIAGLVLYVVGGGALGLIEANPSSCPAAGFDAFDGPPPTREELGCP